MTKFALREWTAKLIKCNFSLLLSLTLFHSILIPWNPRDYKLHDTKRIKINMQSFLSSLTPELQITTFWNVCHVFLGTSTTKCGHESNNAPQSFFFHLITFLLEKSSMRNNSPIRSLFHRHSKVNLICGGYKEKRIYFCMSRRLLRLSIRG